MAKNKHQPAAKPLAPQVPLTPAVPPPDDPLHRGPVGEPVNPDEAREAALARVKALEDAKRMEHPPRCD